MHLQGLVVYAKDKNGVSAFYQQALNLAVIESEDLYDLLRGRVYEVVVHSIPKQYAAQINIARPPVPRDDSAFKPTFVVADLEVVRKAAKSTGANLKPIEMAWSFRGYTMLDGWDPEGNIVQFKQPLQGVSIS